MTFRIELFCDDKNLSSILRALADAGAYNVHPTPVITEQGNGLAPGGLPTKVGLIYKRLVDTGALDFNSVQLKKFMKLSGISPASIGYVSETLVKHKLIRRLPGKGKYTLTKGA
jgi:hypothetical protein